jgi:hypothetical protein
MLPLVWKVAVLVVLASGACGAPARVERPKPTRASAPQPDSGPCVGAAETRSRLNEAVAAGNWLRARSELEREQELCPDSVPEPVPELASHLVAGDELVSALFERAAAARAAHRQREAWDAEARAVVTLERDHGQRLGLTSRFSFQVRDWSRDGRHQFLFADGRVTVLNVEQGQLVTRFPREAADFDIDVSTEAGLVFLRARATRSDPGTCLFELRVLKLPDAKLVRSACIIDFALSADGRRIVVIESAPIKDEHLIASDLRAVVRDVKTWKLVTELEPPLKNGRRDPEAKPYQVLRSVSGATAAVQYWKAGVSMVDVSAGTSRTFAGDPSGIQIADDGTSAAWSDRTSLVLWDRTTGATRALRVQRCARPSGLSFSGQGKKLAVDCGKELVVVDLVTKAEVLRLPVAEDASIEGWVHGDRGLAVSGGARDLGRAVFDVRRKRWVLAPGADGTELVHSGPVVVIRRGERRELAYIDAELRLRPLSTEGCEPWTPIITSDGISVFTQCERGSRSVDLASGAVRVGDKPRGGVDRLIGKTVVLRDYKHVIELFDLDSATRLPGSPEIPCGVEGTFWDGPTLVFELASDSPRTLAVDFGAPLRSTPRRSVVACDGSGVDARANVLVAQGQPNVTICDRADGKQIGTVPLQGEQKLESVRDGGHVLLASGGKVELVRVKDGQRLPLVPAPASAALVGSDLVIGRLTGAGTAVWSVKEGRRIAEWPQHTADLPLLASAELGVTIESAEHALVVRDLWTGREKARLPAYSPDDVDFGLSEVLAVGEDNRASLWRAERGLRLGDVLVHPTKDDVVFLRPSGVFEASGDPAVWTRLLRCEVGASEVPFPVCVDAFHARGAAARALGRP